jgi:cell division protease FtsH
MDGFMETNGVLVIGATNRIESLDEALLRPGRLSKKFCISLPETAEERLEVINLYNKNKKFDETVDFEALSKELIGFSPADIENLLNEAAILSVKKNNGIINKEILNKATMNIVVDGHVKDSVSGRSEEELKTVAWHEAGHALVGKLKGKDITKVTILSTTSGAGGVTFSTPKKEHLLSKEDLEDEVVELYAGRVGELALFGTEDKVTTGASNDFERASRIIDKIVEKWGMSKELGPYVLEEKAIDVESEKLLKMKVDIATKLMNDTKELVKKHYDKLEEIAELLLKKETIYGEDLDKILSK